MARGRGDRRSDGGDHRGHAARVAMRLFAVGVGHDVEFTIEGTLIVLTIGAIVGFLVGVFMPSSGGRHPCRLPHRPSRRALLATQCPPAHASGLEEARRDRRSRLAVAAVDIVLGLMLGVIELRVQRFV